jgi:hypothetical protein
LRIAVFFGSLALAFAAEHPLFTGSWQSADAADIVAIQQTGDSIQITETEHDKHTTVECNTIGKTCKVKGGEISFWYNGSKLVMIESLHGSSRVTEKRWSISQDGKALNLEVVHIAPAGNPEKIVFNRRNGS